MLYFFPCSPYDDRSIVATKNFCRKQGITVGRRTEPYYWRNNSPAMSAVAGLVYHNQWLAPYRSKEGSFLFKKLKRSHTFRVRKDIQPIQKLYGIKKQERSRHAKAIMRADIPSGGWRTSRLRLKSDLLYDILRLGLKAGFVTNMHRFRYPGIKARFMDESDHCKMTMVRVGITAGGKIKFGNKYSRDMNTPITATKFKKKLKRLI